MKSIWKSGVTLFAISVFAYFLGASQWYRYGFADGQGSALRPGYPICDANGVLTPAPRPCILTTTFPPGYKEVR